MVSHIGDFCMVIICAHMQIYLYSYKFDLYVHANNCVKKQFDYLMKNLIKLTLETVQVRLLCKPSCKICLPCISVMYVEQFKSTHGSI